MIPRTQTNIDEVVSAIQSGGMLYQVAKDHPVQFIRMGKGITHWYNMLNGPRTQRTIGYWITGPSGVGKSHWCRHCVAPGTAYFKNDNTKWWDGYDPSIHTTVVWNDFRFTADVPFAMLLNLLDVDPILVQVKGNYVQFSVHRILFTSTITAEQVFRNIPFDVEGSYFQLERRLLHLNFSTRSLIPYTKIQSSTEESFCRVD